MADIAQSSQEARPYYRLQLCPNEAKAEAFLNKMAEEGYRFVSMTAVSSTQHFSKEIESTVWVLVERRE